MPKWRIYSIIQQTGWLVGWLNPDLALRLVGGGGGGGGGIHSLSGMLPYNVCLQV